MHKPTAKGYFSGCGGIETGLMTSGINLIQSLDLDNEATKCMALNKKYFSHSILNSDIKYLTVGEQPQTDIIVGTLHKIFYSRRYSWNKDRG